MTEAEKSTRINQILQALNLKEQQTVTDANGLSATVMVNTITGENRISLIAELVSLLTV